MSVALSPVMSQDLNALVAGGPQMIGHSLEPAVPGGEYGLLKMDEHGQRYDKPPPLHTGADWKIVLHLPEIETWLRGTTKRVCDLTYSVQQDSESRHVDAHLVQLKDICEDISDHVEQIHALLETEFSLKLLSYSVSVLVDIHSVQLLWHQLRVSVLVLRERILRGLQDSNGNYTRQTDILQAFSAEPTEDRLDSLTEVDDSGQLTIRCSQNYLSLDCGITAFELSDYSPSEELLHSVGEATSEPERVPAPDSWACTEMEQDAPELVKNVGLLTVVTNTSETEGGDMAQEQRSGSSYLVGDRREGIDCYDSAILTVPPSPSQEAPPPKGGVINHSPELCSRATNQECPTLLPVDPRAKTPHHCESAPPKRPIRDCFNYNEDSPTQPTVPKRGLFLEDVDASEMRSNTGRMRTSGSLLSLKAELSRSTPSLLDVPDRSKLCLPLKTSYCNGSSSISQSYNCLFRTGDCRLEDTPKNSHKVTITHPAERGGCICPSGKPRQKKVHDGQEAESWRTQKNASGPVSPQPKCSSRALGDGLSQCGSQPMDGQNEGWPLDDQKVPVSSALLPHDFLSSQSESKLGQAGLPPQGLSSWSLGDSGTWNCSPSALQDGRTKDGTSSVSGESSSGKQVGAWYGSEEYLALPSHLKQTEVLALKLENLARLVSPNSSGEAVQNIDDWELSEMNSDSEMYPIFPIHKKHRRLGRVSPSSSSDMAPSLDDSIESGPLSDIFSDEDLCGLSPGPRKADSANLEQPMNHLGLPTAFKSTLIQQLMEDIQHQDNYEAIWEKMEGFVGQLDEFIRWLQEAMETTENWIPPKAETNRLKLYLETHLSFKLNVESHRTLKETVSEEGRQLLELMVSHKSGLKDMLLMIGSQWKELQRQIKRQHSWILHALDVIKAEILATDVSAEDAAGEGSPEAEVQLCSLEAKRDAVEQMSLKLFSEQYSRSNKRKEEFANMSKGNAVGSNSLLDLDTEYQEIWEWLIDMESTVMDRHGLMMSEEQQQHLYKRYSVEMTIREPKIRELLGKIAALSRSGPPLPRDLLQRVDLIREKWDHLGTTLGLKVRSAVAGQRGQPPRDFISPESGTMVKRLEVRIRELKAWLRDTELFIFNSCLRHEKDGYMDPEKQMQHFKSLCAEIKMRRRGIASILRLCQHLLDDQETCHLDADHQSMQLIIVNLERRWEAIIMQAVQWQTRLQKKLGRERETQDLLDSEWMDLNGTGEDAWEWDETDISHKLIGMNEDSSDPSPKVPAAVPCLELEATNKSKEDYMATSTSPLHCPSVTASLVPPVYQVYSLHNVELFDRNQMSYLKMPPGVLHGKPTHYLQNNLSQDSSFSSTKSLPDLFGGMSWMPSTEIAKQGAVSRLSECESGIVSEGDTENTTNSDVCLLGIGDGTCLIKDKCPETFGTQERGSPTHQSREKEGGENVGSCDPMPASCWMKGKRRGFDGRPEPAHSLEEGLQGKRDVLTFYDYSFLQGSSKLQLPMIVTPTQEGDVPAAERATPQGPYHDSIKHIPPHSDLKSNHIILPLTSGQPSPNSLGGVKKWINQQEAKHLPWSSSGSSLESLSPAGDLLGTRAFRSSDCLQRSTSLESWLMSYKSNEDLFSGNGSGDNSLSSDSVGELSKRTLDLLKRLEDIESPSDQKIKHSISDITLQSSSQKMSITGQHSLDVASSINEDSASSLTELSSSEVSLCSEDIVMQKNTIPDCNASFRKHLSRSLAEESDANVSMIVNVSCTSACTDDEDDSDLLSSSTLTLTEEELGMKDEEDDVSSIATDDEIYEESSLMSGIEYVKNELQTWIRPRFMLPQDKKSANPCKLLKCGKWGSSNRMMAVAEALSIEEILKGSARKVSEDISQRKNALALEEQATGQAKEQQDKLVDDMENGNVDRTQEPLLDGLQRISAPVKLCSVPKRRPNRQFCMSDASRDLSASQECEMDVTWGVKSPNHTNDLPRDCDTSHHSNAVAHASSIIKYCNSPSSEVGGENVQDSQSQGAVPFGKLGRRDFLEQSDDCCRASAEDISGSADSCCQGHTSVSEEMIEDDSPVHTFVKEIIDMASTALKNKSQSEGEVTSPTSLSQIREKVLEHSHRSLRLRGGDFYSYLSLSSHDSDCGEVTSYAEDNSSTPVPPEENIECFFEACPEDEPPECESYSPICIVESSSAGSSATTNLEESKPSIECSLSSSMGDQTDPQGWESVSQVAPVLAEGNSLSSQGNSESHSMNSAWGGLGGGLMGSGTSPSMNTTWGNPGGGTRDDSFDTWITKSRDTAPALDLRFTPWYSRGKERLHHDTKTLTCESSLPPLHQESLHQTPTESSQTQHPTSNSDQEPGPPSASGRSSEAHDEL